jgi:hypothetical protein
MPILDASVTGTSGLISIVVSDSYTAATATAVITALDTNLDIGDSVSVYLGYSTGINRVFQGYVKSMERKETERVYTITAANAMIRAVDYFIVSPDGPEYPYRWRGVDAEDLVGDILGMAGLTNYYGGNSGFTFGINTDVEVNLTSAYDYAHFIASILAWHVYCDDNGKCWFVNRPPYPSGDTSIATVTNSSIIQAQYMESDRDLRNRVVVYGAEGIVAEAKAASPYLPAGFYKSVVLASPIIDVQSVADAAAAYNLAKLNRLTKRLNASIIGNPSINCRNCINVTGWGGQYFVYGIEHNWSRSGYMTNMELRK